MKVANEAVVKRMKSEMIRKSFLWVKFPEYYSNYIQQSNCLFGEFSFFNGVAKPNLWVRGFDFHEKKRLQL